jgi:preprotein translocase subunit YajC
MPAEGAANPLFAVLPMLFVFMIFYFLVIRPQQTQQKKHAAAVKQLKKGDQVVTNGGVHGLIAGIKDDVFILKIADNVKIDVSKTAISTIKKQK